MNFSFKQMSLFFNLKIGSYSGIVNLYSTEDLLHSINKDVEPLKVNKFISIIIQFKFWLKIDYGQFDNYMWFREIQ